MNTVCLTWQAPTENVDGSLLTDLAGFEVYWDFQAFSVGDPARMVDIPDPEEDTLNQATGVLQIPAPPGGGPVDIFFRMTAYNTGFIPDAGTNCAENPDDDANDPGNPVNCRETSALSNQVAKTIVFPAPVPGEPTIIDVIINIELT